MRPNFKMNGRARRIFETCFGWLAPLQSSAFGPNHQKEATMQRSNRRVGLTAACAAVAALVTALAFAQEHAGPQQPWSKFKVHDMSRPAPPVVTPGTPSTQEQPGKPPSDAIVLFDG